MIWQIPEREARDRFVEVSELAALIEQCQKEKDFELQGFIILAACTGLRKTAILSRKWEEVKLDVEFPSIFLPKKDSKNRRSNRLPLPQFCVEALKQLPSYQKHEYLFPARANVRYRNVAEFQKPHAWDIGKRFRRIRDLAGITDLRIHDLRHFATTMLFIEGVSDAIIRKMTGHRRMSLNGTNICRRSLRGRLLNSLPENWLMSWKVWVQKWLRRPKPKKAARKAALKVP